MQFVDLGALRSFRFVLSFNGMPGYTSLQGMGIWEAILILEEISLPQSVKTVICPSFHVSL
jgi:hypothetical protein